MEVLRASQLYGPDEGSPSFVTIEKLWKYLALCRAHSLPSCAISTQHNIPAAVLRTPEQKKALKMYPVWVSVS